MPVRLAGFLAGACLAVSLHAQQVTLPLWPNGTPEPAHTTGPERDVTTAADPLVGGKPSLRLSNVSEPALTLFPAPVTQNSRTAVLVFPGGSYLRLSYNSEGTEVCEWLNSIGVNCVLVKYRVPEDGHFPANVEDLEDAQQAMRLTRTHAAEWKIDPDRVGVLGFSAGAHLAVVLCNHPAFAKPGAAAFPLAKVNARPNFAVIIYPGWLSGHNQTGLGEGIDASAETPPTFLLQAENDPVHVENVVEYFRALKELKVQAELHIYSEGGHGYGIRPTNLPVSHWPALVGTWLQTIKMIPEPAAKP